VVTLRGSLVRRGELREARDQLAQRAVLEGDWAQDFASLEADNASLRCEVESLRDEVALRAEMFEVAASAQRSLFGPPVGAAAAAAGARAHGDHGCQAYD
jgi:hypothetical protein